MLTLCIDVNQGNLYDTEEIKRDDYKTGKIFEFIKFKIRNQDSLNSTKLVKIQYH